ncbi:MAG: hypothetical protein QXO86_00900 [Nitrososphaerota archaeon]
MKKAEKMWLMLKPEKIASNRVLIAGEVKSGKTRLLYRFIQMLVEAGYAADITIIDMAPSAVWGVGGKIVEVGDIPEEVRYLTSWEIKPPRLIGREREEVLRLAQTNAELITTLLREYTTRPTKLLIINDATIFVHAGDPKTLLYTMDLSRSWIVTAYYGKKLEADKGSGLTARERDFVEYLMRASDIIIRMAL